MSTSESDGLQPHARITSRRSLFLARAIANFAKSDRVVVASWRAQLYDVTSKESRRMGRHLISTAIVTNRGHPDRVGCLVEHAAQLAGGHRLAMPGARNPPRLSTGVPASHHDGRACHHWHSRASISGDSMTFWSLRPLDCSTRMIFCALSICLTFSLLGLQPTAITEAEQDADLRLLATASKRRVSPGSSRAMCDYAHLMVVTHIPVVDALNTILRRKGITAPPNTLLHGAYDAMIAS
jgi:hypothetical protein